MVRKYSKRLQTNRFDNLLKRYKLSQHFFVINRKLVSRAVLIGTFWALMPIPTQIAMVIFFAFFIRFNIVIALTIVLLTNPLTMPFIFGFEYWLGSLVVKTTPMPIEFTTEWLQENYILILVPLIVGALILGSTLSVMFYALVNRLWIYSVKRERKRN